jgi:hypothetical protein
MSSEATRRIPTMEPALEPGISRRAMLKGIAAAGLGAALPVTAFGAREEERAWRSEVLQYLEKHARPDSGYAWEDQESSHLTPTFAVVGCYHVLKQMPPRKAPRGTALLDQYHQHHLPHPASGKHSAAVEVRVLATGERSTCTIEFVVQ